MLIQVRIVGDSFSEAEKDQITAAARAMGYSSPEKAERMLALELKLAADRLSKQQKLRMTPAVRDWIFGKGKAAPPSRGQTGAPGAGTGTRYRPPAASQRPAGRSGARGDRRGPPRASPRRTAPPAPSHSEVAEGSGGAYRRILEEVAAAERPKEEAPERPRYQLILIAVLALVGIIGALFFMSG